MHIIAKLLVKYNLTERKVAKHFLYNFPALLTKKNAIT